MRILLVLCLTGLIALSPLAASSSTPPFSDDDYDAIVAAVTDYSMSYYEGDGARMERALHPHLSKRTIDDQGKRHKLSEMSAMELVQIIRMGSGKKVPADERISEVAILDIEGDVATVKLTMRSWIDYMHLAKMNGKWQIVNVLWRTNG